MDKIINVDGREVGFRATALTPRLYRHKMGRDMVQDMAKLMRSYNTALAAQQTSLPEHPTQQERVAFEAAQEQAYLSVADLEVFENMAYIMARQYDPSIPDCVEDWLDGFGSFSIYQIIPQITELWGLNNRTTAKPKKK